MSKPSAAVAARIKTDASAMSKDKLDVLRAAAVRLRDATLAVENAEGDVKDKKKLLTKLQMEELPDLFDEAGVPYIGLEADGNMAACKAECQPYYKASIPDDKKDEAFEWLEANGAGDLIRNVFTIELPKDNEDQANLLESKLQEMGLDYVRKKSVPWTTLTAFVKEEIEERQRTPPLNLLGATVGKIVKLKFLKIK